MLRASIVIAIFYLFCPAASAVEIPPRPPAYVVDLAGVVDDNVEQRLGRRLSELEQKTGAQVIVLTVPDMDGANLEDYSLSVAERWGLGQKGRDDGLLMFFAMKERRYRMEVGYGLESILPDAKLGSMARSHIVSAFKQGYYSKGIESFSLAISRVIASKHGVTLGYGSQNYNAYGQRREDPGKWIIKLLALLLLFGPILYMVFKHGGYLSGRRPWDDGYWHSGRGYHGGYGGGFSGGGGFGGGGGGGFGGGGVSGGW